ncbi:endospore germination permease [Bacillus sp. sid0103]|uniref:GerAB/ArcD/ProY family transporter n=1 Tax=Bacillus sp. sid0103 TaxID=2856337 RepID=UPI001C44A1AA|nr:endospore germination permease [Bacillus sp. sid0103]MBV7505821.1 endospore germination permease [Bacillus sp. sid0103]
MLKDEKISVAQFTKLVILFTVGSTILSAPLGLISYARQDAWISVIIGILIGLLVMWLYNTLGIRFPNMTLVEINEKLLGKWLGKVISLFFCCSLFLAAATLLFFLGEFLTAQFIPETPIEVIHILFILIIIQGVRLGIETIARAGEILFPWFIMFFIIFFLFLSPKVEVQNMLPVLETGIKPISLATLLYLEFSSLSLICLLMVFPAYINQPKRALKGFLVGNLIGGILLLSITLLSILVLGVDNSERQLYPSYALARKINVGGFVQRLEAMLAIIWFISLYFKITVYFFGSAVGIAQILNIKDYRPLTLPLGMILVVLSLITYPNVTYSRSESIEIWIPLLLTIGFILPLSLLSVDIIRKRILSKITAKN